MEGLDEGRGEGKMMETRREMITQEGEFVFQWEIIFGSWNIVCEVKYMAKDNYIE